MTNITSKGTRFKIWALCLVVTSQTVLTVKNTLPNTDTGPQLAKYITWTLSTGGALNTGFISGCISAQGPKRTFFHVLLNVQHTHSCFIIFFFFINNIYELSALNKCLKLQFSILSEHVELLSAHEWRLISSKLVDLFSHYPCWVVSIFGFSKSTNGKALHK